MTVTIWHNPRCSKSRAALALIRERGIEPEIVEYLKSPPTTDAIRDALDRLGLPARDLLRRCEPAWRESGLSGDEGDERLIAAMAAAPVLIERPLVMTPKGARIARPTERVADVL